MQGKKRRIDDIDNLEFSVYNPFLDYFSILDFRDNNNSDPLKGDEFIYKNPKQYVDYHLSIIFIVSYNKEIIAFFPLSMSSILIKDIELDEYYFIKIILKKLLVYNTKTSYNKFIYFK